MQCQWKVGINRCKFALGGVSDTNMPLCEFKMLQIEPQICACNQGSVTHLDGLTKTRGKCGGK